MSKCQTSSFGQCMHPHVCPCGHALSCNVPRCGYEFALYLHLFCPILISFFKNVSCNLQNWFHSPLLGSDLHFAKCYSKLWSLQLLTAFKCKDQCCCVQCMCCLCSEPAGWDVQVAGIILQYMFLLHLRLKIRFHLVFHFRSGCDCPLELYWYRLRKKKSKLFYFF